MCAIARTRLSSAVTRLSSAIIVLSLPQQRKPLLQRHFSLLLQGRSTTATRSAYYSNKLLLYCTLPASSTPNSTAHVLKRGIVECRRLQASTTAKGRAETRAAVNPYCRPHHEYRHLCSNSNASVTASELLGTYVLRDHKARPRVQNAARTRACVAGPYPGDQESIPFPQDKRSCFITTAGLGLGNERPLQG